MAYLAKFGDYTLRKNATGGLYIGVYRKPWLGYSTAAFLNCDLGIPASIRRQAKAAITLHASLRSV